MLSILALVLSGLTLIAHVAGAFAVAYRCRSRAQAAPKRSLETVTLVRTVRDVGPFEPETLQSTFGLSYPKLEIMFCAASAVDPAVPWVRRLLDSHPHISARLLIGEDAVSSNAKLNNMVKAWYQSETDWVLFADSNLLLPPDYVDRVLSEWKASTGAVCAPPIGSAPHGLWAEVECAFLNGYQARWQYAADMIGFGFAQGKTMLLRRDIFERAGGIEALGCEPAEDAALTKIVRAQGLSVRLAAPIFTQPLGYRTLRQMIDRQTRWAQLRRATFPLLYVLEILSGVAAPVLAAMLAAPSHGFPPVLAGVTFLGAWIALEAGLTWAAGWHFSWKSPLAWLVREVLQPIIWVRGWLHSSYQWGGQTVILDRRLAISK